jgi:hypothetical protein
MHSLLSMLTPNTPIIVKKPVHPSLINHNSSASTVANATCCSFAGPTHILSSSTFSYHNSICTILLPLSAPHELHLFLILSDASWEAVIESLAMLIRSMFRKSATPNISLYTQNA